MFYQKDSNRFIIVKQLVLLKNNFPIKLRFQLYNWSEEKPRYDN